ncbi:MAG: HAMP domain-containing sensor histidine kinase [Salinimicrobium sp.]
MEKGKLQRLNSSHESAVKKLQESWWNEKGEEAGSSENETFKKGIFEEVFKEVSADAASALFVDAWKEAGIFSVLVLKEQNGDWEVVHSHYFSNLDNARSLKIRNNELEKTLLQKTASLKQSRGLVKKIQEQLLHQEKLASLGQLTAGIAHEIKNPLNFINNFSELSKEYIEEIFENLEQLEKDTISDEVMKLLQDVQMNLERIHEHSRRADRIVRSMLLRSRGESGNKELTDLNALIREYVNLAFHGMRANPHPINVDIQLDLDEKVKLVELNSEDFSRVILNLCNNAFDAMREKLSMEESAKIAIAGDSQSLDRERYLPKLKVSTKQKADAVNLCIEDNGPGVPTEIKDKLMMPFFTTKRAKEGTGLGLSITQGIVKDHNGRINISTKENEYTRFNISLPMLNKKK